jgi:glycosyltransferase involved in cell wall biosynthesis
MRILYYCPEYYCRHGGRSHARGFFKALNKLPSVSEAFLYPDKQPTGVAQNIQGKKTSSERLWFLPPTIRSIVRFFKPVPALTGALIKEINNKRCDALVIRTGMKLPAIGAIKKACPATSVCLEVNSAYFDESFSGLPLRSLFQKWEVTRFRQADAITVVSSYLKTYLEERGLCSEKILVNQNGVEPESMDLTGLTDVREQYGIPRNSFVIGYIGGMETFRRIPEVVGYFAELLRTGNDNTYLLIVGDGKDMPAVRARIEAERDTVKDGVKLAGWRPHSEIPGFLATFDIAIFPFTNDYCSPLKLFEYLGAGVPAIGPDTSAVREIFEDGVHLKLVNQDGSNFVSTILELKNNPQLRIAIGQAGQQRVLSEYTWEKNAERVVSHIQSRSAKRAVNS